MESINEEYLGTKWQYVVYRAGRYDALETILSELNKLGNEGYKVTSQSEHNDCIHYTLCRLKR